jgi:hypothetical protein
MKNASHTDQSIAGSGLLVLALCMLSAFLNSMIFGISNGRHHHPTAQISDLGIFGNFIAFSVAWFVFIRFKRTGLIQSFVAILFMSVVHYLLISNVWTMIAERT